MAKLRLTSEDWLTNLIVAGLSLVVGWAASNIDKTSRVGIWEGAILLLLVVVVAIAIKMMLSLRQEVVRDSNVSVEWCSNFDRTAQLVAEAEEKIVVATAMGTSRDNVLRTSSRNSYLKTIAKKIDRNPNLRYLRLMPSHDYESISDHSIKLSECDAAVADHVKEIAGILDGRNGGSRVATGVSIKLSRPVALLPSTIVIDDLHVCFALPQKLARPINGVESVVKDVIVISDRSGQIPRRMAAMIESVADRGLDITGTINTYI